MKTFLQSLRLLAGLTLLTGGLYPLAVWAVGQAFFRHAAEGSVLESKGHVVGSALLAQKQPIRAMFPPGHRPAITPPSPQARATWPGPARNCAPPRRPMPNNSAS